MRSNAETETGYGPRDINHTVSRDCFRAIPRAHYQVGNSAIWAYLTNCEIFNADEGMMVAEEKRKKTTRFFLSFWYPIQGPGWMAHAPSAGTGDSMSRFRRYYCSTLINYVSYFLVGYHFCFQPLSLDETCC